jgi:DNA-binding PadR family transcriptional regulator
MPSRALRTPLNLAILGLLAERPRHVYDLRVTMRERGHDRTVKLKNATLYDAAGRLARAGLVEAGAPIRDSALPERTEYHLTDSGAERLATWVRELLTQPTDDPSDLVTALNFMFVLPRGEAIERLEERAAILDAAIEADAERLTSAIDRGVPEVFLSEHDYSQTLRRAEHAWLLALAESLRSGRLTWPTARPQESSP